MMWSWYSITLILMQFSLVIEGRDSRAIHCLQKTRLTIFIDSREVITGMAYGIGFYGSSFLISVIRTVLRDPCYEGRLYEQLDREFIEIKDIENVQSNLEKVFHNFRYIRKDEMYNFVDEFRHRKSDGTTREIVFYLYI